MHLPATLHFSGHSPPCLGQASWYLATGLVQFQRHLGQRFRVHVLSLQAFLENGSQILAKVAPLLDVPAKLLEAILTLWRRIIKDNLSFI